MLAQCSLQICLNPVTLEGFWSMNSLFQVRSQHLNEILVQTLASLLQNPSFDDFYPFTGGLGGVLWINRFSA